MDTTATYRAVRERITDLLRAAPQGSADQMVPCCPQWTVRDVVAHLSGVVDDALKGNLAEAGTDPWTQSQVDARRDRSLDELLEEWNTQATTLEDALGPGGAPPQLVFDTVTHEHDLRSAIGRPATDANLATDADSVAVAMEFVAAALPASVAELGLPELRIEPTDDGPAFTIGSGGPPGVLRATSLDLLRSWSGRRSLDQIRALDWDGDPTAWLPAFTWGPFRVPGAAVDDGPVPTASD